VRLEIAKKWSLKPKDRREEEIIKEIRNLKELGCNVKIDETSRSIIINCPAGISPEGFQERIKRTTEEEIV